MAMPELVRDARAHLRYLCSVTPNRRTGSPGNRAAVGYVAEYFRSLGLRPECRDFACLDFDEGAARLTCGSRTFTVRPSPFSLGVRVRAPLVVARTVQQLEQVKCRGAVLLLIDEIASEPLMPRKFIFYNPDSHKHIYRLLARKRPAAIITATSRSPQLVGGEYPFAMIEDGDFDIPSVFCADTMGARMVRYEGAMVSLVSDARRNASRASNVIVRFNPGAPSTTLVCAHVDARAGTPGATDNAGGVVMLMALARLLAAKAPHEGVEIVAFNGEDYYSVGGQMQYLRRYGSALPRVKLVINADDIGYGRARTAYSFYGCTPAFKRRAGTVLGRFDSMVAGEQWYQGDHMIFVQRGMAALALTSEQMPHLMATITHTRRDTPSIVNCGLLVEAAEAVRELVVG